MGNSSKKLAARCAFLSKDEQVVVSNAFRVASKNSERIKDDDLMKIWSPLLDVRLSQYINNYLFGKGDTRSQTVEFERFAELFVYCTRGTVDDKLKILLTSLGDEVPYMLIKEYVESVVSSFMKIQKLSNSKQFKSWHSRGCFISPINIQRLAENLTSELSTERKISSGELEKWLQGATLLGQLLIFVFTYLYRIPQRDKSVFPNIEEDAVNDTDKDKSLVPCCKGLDLIPTYPSILDLNQLVFINAHLPQQYQLDWRFLFSSEIHGDSFSTLIGRIVNQGPSILIIEDKNGYMFGGFAPANWALGPNYYGDDSSFLFTLAPKMRVFPTTGYNQHFQYLNLHQQTIPNGLAMGGQHHYCGLWLDENYGYGHSSESCTTYLNYFQMSHDKEFTYKHLEVWSLGSPPVADTRKGRSILDSNPEAKAVLDLSGRKTYSDGLREPPPT